MRKIGLPCTFGFHAAHRSSPGRWRQGTSCSGYWTGTRAAAQDADKSRLLEAKAQDGRAICGRGGGGQV